MSRFPHYAAGVAVTAVLASSTALAEASSGAPPHVVYGCKVGQIWKTPGHHPVGLITQGTPFEVVGYSPSGRWALGTAQPAGPRSRQHGWVRRAALCRTRPV